MARNNTERILTLQEKIFRGTITEIEELELEAIQPPTDPGMATHEQLTYIDILLGMLGEMLEDYTATASKDLTIEEASDLIETLKDAVTDADAWDD